MILMSFNSSKFSQLPIEWTFDWYIELLGNKKLLKAGLNSLIIAFVSTIISTVLGTCAAYAFFRFEFSGKRILQILLLPPITIPWLIIGTSMLIFFFWVGIDRPNNAPLYSCFNQGHYAWSCSPDMVARF